MRTRGNLGTYKRRFRKMDRDALGIKQCDYLAFCNHGVCGGFRVGRQVEGTTMKYKWFDDDALKSYSGGMLMCTTKEGHVRWMIPISGITGASVIHTKDCDEYRRYVNANNYNAIDCMKVM